MTLYGPIGSYRKNREYLEFWEKLGKWGNLDNWEIGNLGKREGENRKTKNEFG